jgi:hypothetical protein
MTDVRGLQLAWNDKAAASGLMTKARQDRSPAACAASAAYVKHFTLATLPACNAGMFGWEGRCASRSLHPEMECLSTEAVYHRMRERR